MKKKTLKLANTAVENSSLTCQNYSSNNIKGKKVKIAKTAEKKDPSENIHTTACFKHQKDIDILWKTIETTKIHRFLSTILEYSIKLI